MQHDSLAADPALAALAGKWRPIGKRPGYAIGLLVLSLAIIILPVLYAALIGAAGYGVYWHLTENLPNLGAVPGRGRAHGFGVFLLLLVYLAPAIAGITLIFFMLKPLIAPGARHGDPITLEAFEEPKLHAFVRGVCALIGAPPPRRIDVDADINASASFRSGAFSLVRRGDLVLTIGLPLVAAMSKRQFAGVLAHEFGHFAQGAGMRATYLASSVVTWFIRAAYERDAWDMMLWQYSHSGEWWSRLLAFFVRLCIWIARQAIRVIAFVGMLLCSYMLRQMEYDADRYEVQLAGSGEFASIFQRLHELAECAPKAMEESRRNYLRTKQLPDDFPALVADYCRRLTPEARDEAARRTADRTSGPFATHPSTASRIAAAKALDNPGLYLDGAPARELFSNFNDACRKATYGHFRGVLGNMLEVATFAPTAPMLKADDAAVARQGSLARYLGYDPPAWRPVFPPMREVLESDDPRPLVERLKAARAKLKPLAEKARAKTASYRAAHEEIAKWEQARAILDAGFTVNFKALGLPSTSRQGVGARIDKLTGDAADAAAVIDDAGDVAAARIAGALSLLGARGITKYIPDAKARRARADVLLAAMGALREILPLARQVRLNLGAVIGVAATIKDQKTLDRAKTALRPLCDRIRNDMDSARRIGGAATDPFSPSELPANLGETMVGATPGWREFEDIASAAETFVDRFTDVTRRTLGELVHAAEDVERALAAGVKKQTSEAPEVRVGGTPSRAS